MTNPSKHDETTGMPILNFSHKWLCAKITLQYCGRQAQIQELDVKFFRTRQFCVLCCLSYQNITNSSKNNETIGMLILNFKHKCVCAEIMLQHCGRQAQIQRLDATFFGNTNFVFFAACLSAFCIWLFSSVCVCVYVCCFVCLSWLCMQRV